jgi:hypothetical protein
MYDTQKPDVEELIHYGKKGMKWGVRNAASKTANTSKRAAKATGRGLDRAATRIGDANFEMNTRKVNVGPTENRIMTQAGKNLRTVDIPKINAKPEYQKAVKLKHRLRHPKDPATKAYRQDVKTAYIKRLEEAANSMTNTSGTRKYTIKDADGDLPKSDVFWNVRTTKIAHADGVTETKVRVVMDENGFITDLVPVVDKLMQGELFTDDFLAHYGKKGMKWGVRNSDRPSGTPRSTERRAKKDAKEVARAKMFYGDGAGTRRKLINKSVEARSKRDPAYKEALDRNLSKQDLSKHAAKAVSERRRKDVAQSTAKTARGIKNLIYNTGAPVTLAAAVAYKASQDPAVQRVVKNAGSKTMKTVRDYQNTQATKDLFKKMGLQ